MHVRMRYVCVAAGLAAMSGSSNARAQVAFGPGFVVAPCVCVEWNGNHVHVCAPFVNLTVDLPCCCGCRDYCGQPIESHSGGQPTFGKQLPVSPTRQDLAVAADELRKSLASFKTDGVWRHYLSLAPNEALSAQPSSGANDWYTSGQHKAFVAALRHFDKANQDPDCRAVADLPAFQKMHTLLANYVARQDSTSSVAENARSISMNSRSTVSTSPSGIAFDTAHTLPAHAGNAAAGIRTRSAQLNQGAAEELPAPTPKGGI
jgi:hypothetical protein